MQHKQAKASKPVEDNEDDYENDFEDYDDDFEASEDLKVAPPKPSVAPIVPAKVSEISAPAQSASSNFNAPSDAKKSMSVVNTVSGASAKATRGGIGSSLSRSMVDPRGVRIQRVLASNVLDLKVERATLLNIPPSSKYDLYLNELRATDAKMKQMGVPTDMESRDMEVNTDEVLMVDKEVQFCNGDDTKFLNVLKSIKQKKSRDGEDAKGSDNNNNTTSLTREFPTSSDRIDSTAGSKLSDFLRRTSSAIEGLLTESNMAKASNRNADRDHKMLSDSSPWKDAGKDSKNGANELLRSRNVSFLKFSEYQNDVFLAIHPFSDKDEDDLRPFKTLISIWNCDNVGGPSYILEGSGDIEVAAFSATQAHFVLGGTSDGCLYLWDLREPASNHQDRDSIDLKIQRGVRKPSFSTHFLSLTADMLDAPQDEDLMHNARILDISSSGGAASSSSQFTTLDQTGKVIFWVSQDAHTDDARGALRASPWSNVTLVPTKSISSLGTKAASSSRNVRSTTRSITGDSWLDKSSFLQSALDDSFLLFPERDGRVSKVVRIGEPSAPPSYSRSMVTEHIESVRRANEKSQMEFSSQVTCMALRPTVQNTPFPSLMLIGRADGSIDLFQSDQQYPILSWNVGSLLASRNVEASLKKQKILLLKWLPFSPSSFLAIDGNATIHHFDLLMDVYKPFRSESLGLAMNFQPRSVNISFPRSHVDTMHIVAYDSKKKFKIMYRHINVTDISQGTVPSITEETALFESLSRSTVNAAHGQRVVLGQVAESKS